MAKICKNCGVKHRNDAVKCMNCGTDFEDLHKQTNKKKFVLYGIIGTVLAAVAIVSVVLLTSPEAAVRRIMNCYKRNDPEAIVEYFPDFFIEGSGISRKLHAEMIEENVEDLSEYLFSFSVNKAESPSEKEHEELMETFSAYAGYYMSEREITDIKIVWVDYKGHVTGFWPSNATRFIMIKYQGRWYWWPDNVNR